MVRAPPAVGKVDATLLSSEVVAVWNLAGHFIARIVNKKPNHVPANIYTSSFGYPVVLFANDKSFAITTHQPLRLPTLACA
ncbi:hypothetical protein EVAR_76392_1 [Eumeta japonica]|uniref:Uncharacterized protein n=1 Tax=Eumeta variegata TaxID=151549 RepID=A0A4C1TB64_EUMVA|nr:hypothetical protein EVAR_76392_1 [Eumeta japonica]